MNPSRNGDAFPAAGTGATSHATHVGHPEGAAPPPPLADIMDGLGANWESAWIDLGGEG